MLEPAKGRGCYCRGMDRRAALEALLSVHAPLDSIEHDHRARMLDLLRAPGDPWSRLRFDPGHFTASAFVLAPDRPALLQVRHARLDRWLQPGGHVEPSDLSLLDTACREVAEETGRTDLSLDPRAGVPFDLDIHRIPARGPEPEHLHFDVRFLFRASSAACRAAPGTHAVRWVVLAQLEAHGNDPGLSRVLARMGRLSPGPRASARSRSPRGTPRRPR